MNLDLKYVHLKLQKTEVSRYDRTYKIILEEVLINNPRGITSIISVIDSYAITQAIKNHLDIAYEYALSLHELDLTKALLVAKNYNNIPIVSLILNLLPAKDSNMKL